jgi:hypothetical protein
MANQRRGRGRSTGRGRLRPRYVWTGIQVNAPQDVTAVGTVNIIVSEAVLDAHGSNVVIERIRGNVHYTNDDTDAPNGTVRVAHKILVANVNDAGGVTDDINALDTDEEDIARRILTQFIHVLGAEAATDFLQTELDVEIDVRVKIKIKDPKMVLAIFQQSTTINRARSVMNLRALMRIG